MTDLERAICESLNQYCFLNIWNEPTSEYRVNIRPVMLDENSRKGSIVINGLVLSLPTTTEAYYLYSISVDCFRNSFWLPKQTWVDGTELCNNYDILMHVYTDFGFMCNYSKCHLLLLPNENAYLLAVAKSTLTKLIKHTDSDKIYVTIYKDSDIANKTTLYSYVVPTTDRNGVYRLNILNKIKSLDPSQTIVYVNGYEVELKNSTQLDYNDHVDIVHDTNIITSYTVDLTIGSNYNLFYSTQDELDKLLVHTPKANNPDNKVLTHNTADFFIRRKTPKKYVQEGLYVQRTADRSISQVTHNDFSIPVYILDAYRDYLQTQAVTLRVIIRQHDKDNILIRDKNYLDMLYIQSDEDIVKCLMGKQPNAPDFWKAGHVEQSTYVHMMFDIPDTITVDNMYTYIEGLGYYHTISLICQRVSIYTVSDLFNNYIEFSKPMLFRDRDVYPILYHNGSKIPYSDYILKNDEDSFNVSLLNNVFNIGDNIEVEMFLDGNDHVFDYTITENNLTVKIPYTDVIVYEEFDNGQAMASAVDYKTKYTYSKIETWTGVATVHVDEDKKETTYVFSTSKIGKTFIFQNKYCVRPLNLVSTLREKINNGDSLAFPLNIYTYNNNRAVPILEPESIQLFLNGKYLVNGLDYFVQKMTGALGAFAGYQLVIQNKSYLLGEDKDTIECIVTSAEIENTSFGFIKNDKIIPTTDNFLIMWFENISTCHVEGYMELNINNRCTHIEIPVNKYRQGAPYELTTNIPTIVKEFIDKYHDNDDIERMKAINEYFYGNPSKIDGPIILPFSHQIYSIYLNEIIGDILKGNLQLAFDPDADRLVKQVSDYNYLKNYDLIFNDVSILDVTYIDIYPTYIEWEDVDKHTYKLVHALIKELLPEDDFSSGEIVNVN